MGHVPTGPIPEERPSADLPRRQRRGGRAPRSRAAHRRRLGTAGEAAAAAFLRSRGCVILDHNVRVGRHEIDLLASDGGTLVAVEVKAGSSGLEHFTIAKEESVRAAMALLEPRPVRLDLVTIDARGEGLLVRWYRDWR